MEIQITSKKLLVIMIFRAFYRQITKMLVHTTIYLQLIEKPNT